MISQMTTSKLPKLEPVPGGFRFRLRYGEGIRRRFQIDGDLESVVKRIEAIEALNASLCASGNEALATKWIPTCVTEPETVAKREAQAAALSAGTLKAKASEPKADAITVRQFGERWTSGALKRDWQLTITNDNTHAVFLLEKHVYPVIGNVPLREVTRKTCDEVKRRLPATLSETTKAHVTKRVNQLLNLAATCEEIEKNPLPPMWVLRPNPKQRPILYPAEEAKLIGCTAIDLGIRLFYGFLFREGGRKQETHNIQRWQIDLEHGTVDFDGKNKTKSTRTWKLSPDVVEALRGWFELRPLKPNDRIFTSRNGEPINVDHLASRVREHLRLAGVVRERLFKRTDRLDHFGIHCLRHSFVTLALMRGESDEWVRSRTGHTTDEILKYRHQAQTVAELALGRPAPLAEALGLLPAARPVPANRPNRDSAGTEIEKRWSGRRDSNPRPLDPQSSALARLRHAPDHGPSANLRVGAP